MHHIHAMAANIFRSNWKNHNFLLKLFVKCWKLRKSQELKEPRKLIKSQNTRKSRKYEKFPKIENTTKPIAKNISHFPWDYSKPPLKIILIKAIKKFFKLPAFLAFLNNFFNLFTAVTSKKPDYFPRCRLLYSLKLFKRYG